MAALNLSPWRKKKKGRHVDAAPWKEPRVRNHRARAYCLFNVSRKRAKYELNVTNPLVPWKNARPPVSSETRFNELCP
jgi:hypothetical protein